MTLVTITFIIVSPLTGFAGVLLGYRIGSGRWPWEESP